MAGTQVTGRGGALWLVAFSAGAWCARGIRLLMPSIEKGYSVIFITVN
jgi:hypothetical protein